MEGIAWSENDNVVRPGEIELDGVVASPDGLAVGRLGDAQGMWLEEYKVIWAGWDKNPHLSWYRVSQVKAYLKVLGLDSAVMKVLYPCGNYKPPVPTVKVYRMQFTPQEIEETWRVVVSNKHLI